MGEKPKLKKKKNQVWKVFYFQEFVGNKILHNLNMGLADDTTRFKSVSSVLCNQRKRENYFDQETGQSSEERCKIWSGKNVVLSDCVSKLSHRHKHPPLPPTHTHNSEASNSKDLLLAHIECSLQVTCNSISCPLHFRICLKEHPTFEIRKTATAETHTDS